MRVDHKTKPTITGAEIHLYGEEELHKMRAILDYYFSEHPCTKRGTYYMFARNIYDRLCIGVEWFCRVYRSQKPADVVDSKRLADVKIWR